MNLRIKRGLALIILLELLMVPLVIFDNSVISYTIGNVLWLVTGFYYSLKKLRGRFSLFCLNLGFFLFLIGGYVFSYIKTGTLEYFGNAYFTPSYEAIIHALRSLYICIASVNFFYLLLEENQRKNNNKYQYDPRMRVPQSVLIFVKTVLVLSYMCALVEESITTMIMRSTTYSVSDAVMTGLPSIITYIGAMYYIALFAYWASYPHKKGTMLSIVSLLLLEVIILVSGERGEPITMVLVIAYYIFKRNQSNISDIQISKKAIWLIVILLPVMLFGLESLSNTRYNREYDASITEGATDFFDSQGGSIKIVANAYDLRDTITQMGGRTFVIGEIRYYLKHNFLTRLILGEKKSLRSIEDAYSGDNYLRSYGFAYAPVTYNKGLGAGSSYIAEVYHDGGYILLFVFNIGIAFLLLKLDTQKNLNYIPMIIALNIFRFLPLLPRGMALDWLTDTFSVENIAFLLLIYILLQWKEKKRTIKI